MKRGGAPSQPAHFDNAGAPGPEAQRRKAASMPEGKTTAVLSLAFPGRSDTQATRIYGNLRLKIPSKGATGCGEH